MLNGYIQKMITVQCVAVSGCKKRPRVRGVFEKIVCYSNINSLPVRVKCLMSCLYPVDCFMLSEHLRGGVLPTVVHNENKILPRHRDQYMPSIRPCGSCIECRLQKSIYIATRCVHTASCYDQNAFLTLTYKERPLAYSVEKKDGTISNYADYSLKTEDIQNFWRRLRAYLARRNGPLIKYYAAGEYGDAEGERVRLTLGGKWIGDNPHYHACLFGYDFPDKQYKFKNRNGDIVYTSQILEDLWGHGQCSLGDVTFESAAYVARYTCRKIYGDKAASHYEGRMPEKSWSSQGLGEEWFLKYNSDVYPCDKVTLYGGRSFTPPPYYDKLLLKYDPDLWEEVQNRRAEKIIVQKNNFQLERYFEDGKPVSRSVSDVVRRAQFRVNKLDNDR